MRAPTADSAALHTQDTSSSSRGRKSDKDGLFPHLRQFKAFFKKPLLSHEARKKKEMASRLERKK